MASSAECTLVKRAVSCSFSSVFHLKEAGLDSKSFNLMQNVFTAVVILPMGILGSSYLISSSAK